MNSAVFWLYATIAACGVNLVACGVNGWLISRNRRLRRTGLAALEQARNVAHQVNDLYGRIGVADLAVEQAAIRLWAERELPLDEFVTAARPAIEEYGFVCQKKAAEAYRDAVKEVIGQANINLENLPPLPQSETARREALAKWMDGFARAFAEHCLDMASERAARVADWSAEV